MTVWNREREQREKQRELAERDHNERNEREKDSSSSSSSATAANSRQNGHRAGTSIVDADVLERVKQRKEEEERRITERKQAAAKKLLELEQKISNNIQRSQMSTQHSTLPDGEHATFNAPRWSKLGGGSGGGVGSGEDSADATAPTASIKGGDAQLTSDFRSMTQISGGGNDSARGYGSEGKSRGYESKYERDINSRERDGAYKDRDGFMSRDRERERERDRDAPRGQQFHANLPPRFQKQRDQERGPYERSSSNLVRGSNTFAGERDGKNVPFAQQYDPRYIHSQNYKQTSASSSSSHHTKRNVGGGSGNDEIVLARRGTDIAGASTQRKRFDSEDDDRFSSSGRESISRNSASDRHPPQLARSISDSSQRKTSVSSEDKPLDGSLRSDRSQSREKIGSWADELELDSKKDDAITVPQTLKSQLSNTSIGSSSMASANDDNQPKHILQRVRKVSTDSRSDKEKSEERESGKFDEKAAAAAANNQTSAASSIIEGPKSWADCVPDTPESAKTSSIRKSSENANELLAAATLSPAAKSDAGDNKKILESVPETNEQSATDKKSDEKLAAAKQAVRNYTSGQGKDGSSEDTAGGGKSHSMQKRSSPRGTGAAGGRNEMRGPNQRGSGSYPSYRGGSGGTSSNNWNNNRRGGRSNHGRYDYSESEGSDDEYHSRRKDDGNFKQSHGQHASQKEGGTAFVPRGEPSRRGRGGGATSSSSFRRGPAPVVKRIDNYGPPSAKSPFGPDNKSDKEKTEDKTKQNQIALNAGIKKTGSDGAAAAKEYESTSEQSDSQDKSKMVSTASAGAKSAKPPSTANACATIDKKNPVSKPSFGGPQQQRKDVAAPKVESHKSDDAQAARADKSNNEKSAPGKKDDTFGARNSSSGAIGARGKPSVINQQMAPMQQQQQQQKVSSSENKAIGYLCQSKQSN